MKIYTIIRTVIPALVLLASASPLSAELSAEDKAFYNEKIMPAVQRNDWAAVHRLARQLAAQTKDMQAQILMRQLELQAVTMQGIQALQQGDGEKARRFFQQAANQGNGDALNMLGQMYISGLGNTPINAQYGISLVQQAARVGCRAAQDYLRQRRIPW